MRGDRPAVAYRSGSLIDLDSSRRRVHHDVAVTAALISDETISEVKVQSRPSELKKYTCNLLDLNSPSERPASLTFEFKTIVVAVHI